MSRDYIGSLPFSEYIHKEGMGAQRLDITFVFRIINFILSLQLGPFLAGTMYCMIQDSG